MYYGARTGYRSSPKAATAARSFIMQLSLRVCVVRYLCVVLAVVVADFGLYFSCGVGGVISVRVIVVNGSPLVCLQANLLAWTDCLRSSLPLRVKTNAYSARMSELKALSLPLFVGGAVKCASE